MLSLDALARAASALSSNIPEDCADVYWAAYAALVRGKSPTMQRRLMKLLADGATLQAASELFRAAHGESRLSFNVMSARGDLPSIAWVNDAQFRQVAGPLRSMDEGHAVLLAAIHGAIYLQHKGAVRAAG